VATLSFHLLVVWLIWGTTYAAIAVSLEGLPAFAIAAGRFVLAGMVVLALARALGRPWPGWLQVRAMLPVGIWLIAVGDGLVIWAAQYLPSGQVAVIVATTPLFFVLALWLREGDRPGRSAWVAVAAGLLGTALVGFAEGGGVRADAADGLRALAVLASVIASAAWAWGSVLLRGAREVPSLLVATGLQLLWGGLILAGVATALGEWALIEPARLLGRPGAAILFLVFGSCALGFSSYAWLVRRTGPALAGSWAFVNPVVALWAGHLLLGEPLGGEVWAGTAAVLVAVLAAQREERRRGAREAPPGTGL
jgi:drug/metabolite transporter (DMT)-like permease